MPTLSDAERTYLLPGLIERGLPEVETPVADHIENRGVDFFRAICERDCEGIVAKLKLGSYAVRPATWFKVLNPAYTQKRGRREMFDSFRGRAATVPSLTPESVS